MRSLRASPLFTAAVLLALVLAGLNALMVALMALRLDALLPGPFARMGHFTQLSHRSHDLTFAFLFVPAVLGLVVQLRRPSENVAGQMMAVIPSVALALTLLLTSILWGNASVLQPPWVMVGLVALIATLLHPASSGFLRSFRVSRISWLMLALVSVAAVPLLAFASTNIRLQGTVPDDHARAGHYGFMAAFAMTVIGVGFLASLRPDGWRLPAWVAGLLPALLGIASLVYPDAASSLGQAWALAAVAWGIGFVAAVELAQRLRTTEESTPLADLAATGAGPDLRSSAGTPRWAKVAALIALAAGVLLVLLLVQGGHGPSRHGAPAPHMKDTATGWMSS